MYLFLAYLFVAFTVTVVLLLLWTGWENRPEEHCEAASDRRARMKKALACHLQRRSWDPREYCDAKTSQLASFA